MTLKKLVQSNFEKFNQAKVVQFGNLDEIISNGCKPMKGNSQCLKVTPCEMVHVKLSVCSRSFASFSPPNSMGVKRLIELIKTRCVPNSKIDLKTPN